MRTNRIRLIWLVAVVAVGFAALALTGCDSKSRADETPAGTTLTVSANPSSVDEGDPAVVEAVVLNDGSGLAGQIVTFSFTGTGDGYFSPATDTTDGTGTAASVFTATASGSITITASIVGSSLSTTTGLAIQSTQSSGGGSGNLTLTATPSLLLANGTDTAQITIVVRDDLAQPAPDQTVVKLAAGEKFVDNDGNGYWSAGIDSLVFDANNNGTWDGYGLIPSTAQITGGNGSVTVNYVSGNDAITVYVKATVDDNGISGSKDVTLQLTPNASINSIYMASDSMQLSVKQTGGIETSLLRATCYDINGNSVPEGLPVNFIVLDGPGGGEHLGTVGYGPYAAVTNSQGVATAPFSSGTVSGTVRIRAYADTVLSNAAQLLISAGPPAYIVVGREECNTPYWATVAGENPIVAVVSDIYLNPVNDSTVVYFSTDEGTMKSHQSRTEEHNGIAKTIWYSGNNVNTADGVVEVYAETYGGTVADTTFFYNTWVPDTLIVSGMPGSLTADGSSKYTVAVYGIDLNGNPVDGGTTFDGEARITNVGGGELQDGCFTASDRVQFTAPTLDIDYSTPGGNDDGIGATDVFTFWHGAGATSTFQVQLLTGTAYSGNSRVNGESSAGPGDVVALMVSVADRWGNPLGDHSITMTASGGTVLDGTGESNAYGEAVSFSWQAPAGAGDYTLTFTDTDPRGGIILTHKVTVE